MHVRQFQGEGVMFSKPSDEGDVALTVSLYYFLFVSLVCDTKGDLLRRPSHSGFRWWHVAGGGEGSNSRKGYGIALSGEVLFVLKTHLRPKRTVKEQL